MMIALSIGLLIVLGAIVFLWRKIVNLKESLDNLVTFNHNAMQTLTAACMQVPQLLANKLDEAMTKAVNDYIAAHPPTDNLDGVTYDDLVAAMQAITEDTKGILINANLLPQYFDGVDVREPQRSDSQEVSSSVGQDPVVEPGSGEAQ